MFISFVMSALLSALPNACDPAPQAEEMSNGLVCQDPLCVYNENGTLTTKPCNPDCTWQNNAKVACDGWECEPYGGCRWFCE